MLSQLKKDLTDRFEMTDLGEAHYILGLQLTRDRANRTLFLSQADYVERLVDRYDMTKCSPKPTLIRLV